VATSQNGFPALLPASRSLYTWNVAGTKQTRLRMRNGSAGFLLAHMAAGFDKNVEDIDLNYLGGKLDDWAYAYRPVRGYSILSNHASGTAIDLNATEHPLGVRGTFTPQQVAAIEKRLRIYGGTIRWGGHYSGRLDAMHFEVNAPLSECEKVAKRLMHETKIGKRLLVANPGQERVILS